MKYYLALALLVLAGFGCTAHVDVDQSDIAAATNAVKDVVSAVSDAVQQDNGFIDRTDTLMIPTPQYVELRTVKGFGEYVEDRFTGYHTGEDVEVEGYDYEVPVNAIADGTVSYAGIVDGYGGVMVVAHDVDGETVSAIYGHLDPASMTAQAGDEVALGDRLAYLGDNESEETDGERKHLHFALYPGSEVRFAGYVATPEELRNWINPNDFFMEHGIDVASPARTFDAAVERGGDVFHLSFEIPAGWEVEYVPSIQALNLYTLSGSGSARERSQMFIRYFDASSFLTLSTVDIYSTEDRVAGADDYTARMYDIEKKASVADFPDQPSWRNERHLVTDFRGEDGYTRYYVVAKSPDLEWVFYEEVLGGMKIVE